MRGKKHRKRAVTCRKCGSFEQCPEASRMYPCTAFKRRQGISDDMWDFVGACMVVLFAPVMCIIVNVVRCFI